MYCLVDPYGSGRKEIRHGKTRKREEHLDYSNCSRLSLINSAGVSSEAVVESADTAEDAGFHLKMGLTASIQIICI